VILILHHYKP
jgi:hypothetical protein